MHFLRCIHQPINNFFNDYILKLNFSGKEVDGSQKLIRTVGSNGIVDFIRVEDLQMMIDKLVEAMV
jgi:hypothetical protein